MKSFMPKLLFYYSALASIFITVSIVFTSQTLIPVIFATLFLPVTAYFIIEFFRQMRGKVSDTGSGSKKGEVAVIIVVFVLLVGLSIRNIYIGAHAVSTPASPEISPSPLIFKKTPTPEPAKTIEISITDGSVSVNIREGATIYSKKVAEAKAGDTFTYTEVVSGWYKISLSDGKSGFISSKYVKGASAI